MAGCRHTPAARETTFAGLPGRHWVVTDQLEIYSDFPLSPQHPVVDELKRVRTEVTTTLELPPSDQEVIVYLFPGEQEYRQFMSSMFPSLPYRRAWFFGSGLEIYTFWSDQVGQDLRHEFTHGLLHASLGPVPLWLDEGLAEYFENGGARLTGPNIQRVRHLQQALANRWHPDLVRLERLDDGTRMTEGDYQESWGWVHFMLNSGPEPKRELLNYLAELKTRSNPEPLSARLTRLSGENPQRFATYVSGLRSGAIASDRNSIRSNGHSHPH